MELSLNNLEKTYQLLTEEQSDVRETIYQKSRVVKQNDKSKNISK